MDWLPNTVWRGLLWGYFHGYWTRYVAFGIQWQPTNSYDKDNSLAIILREYVAKQKNLPGVRTHEYAEPWPSSSTARSAPSGSANNGGDFVSARRSLLSRFALPWLLELHSFDPAFYCQIVFDACCNIVGDEDADFETTNSLNGQNRNKDVSHIDISPTKSPTNDICSRATRVVIIFYVQSLNWLNVLWFLLYSMTYFFDGWTLYFPPVRESGWVPSLIWSK